MIAAIMQPYFFPYIGYFQLMQAVDVFVIYDDVQYMKGGWINRNRIRGNGAPAWLTLPVSKASHELPINQREYLLSKDGAIERVEQRLQSSYATSPFWAEQMPAVSALLGFGNPNVAVFNEHLLATLARRLGIGCKFLLSSQIDRPSGLRGQSKVIDLCRRIGASRYINSIGGMHLYDGPSFEAAGLQLSFLRTLVPPADLESGPQHLSILDLLFRHGTDACRKTLLDYEVVVNRSSRPLNSTGSHAG